MNNSKVQSQNQSIGQQQQYQKQNQSQQQQQQQQQPLPSSSSLSLNNNKSLTMTRGFSRVEANEDILKETRSFIESNLVKDKVDSSVHMHNELSLYSFMLPNLNKYENDDYKFRDYLNQDLIEIPTLNALNDSGHLNWWTRDLWEDVCRPLYPMVTSGDGNCLLHAASLSMWGLHDRHLSLRRSLHSTLESIKENESALWRRWKWEEMCKNRKYGLIYNEDEWAREWRSLLRLSSFQPRSTNTNENGHSDSTTNTNNTTSNETSNDNTTVYFESLEEFHVFLLAHILRRPIIIVSDTMLHDADGEPLSPIPFGGIYLPLECNPAECHRYPLVLAYDSAHFSALVLMESELDMGVEQDSIVEINKKLQVKWPYSIIPITYANRELLPVHFAFEPGRDYDWSKFPSPLMAATNDANNNDSLEIELSRDEKMFLIQRYLDLVKLELVDPIPSMTKRNQATNSSGQRVNITNVSVPEPPNLLNISTSSSSTNSSSTKLNSNINGRSSSNLKDKIVNFFAKKTEPEPAATINNQSKLRKSTTNNVNHTESRAKNGPSSLLKNLKTNHKTSSIPQAISYNRIDPHANNFSPQQVMLMPTTNGHHNQNQSPNITLSTSSTYSIKQQQLQPVIFHKQTVFKSWQHVLELLDGSRGNATMLGVKLNLAKPPKYKQMIANYIQLAKQKYEIYRQQQVQHQQHQLYNQQQQQQQQMQKFKPIGEHYCTVNRADCTRNELCNQCQLKIMNNNGLNTANSSNNSSLKSLTLTTTTANTPPSKTQFSYNAGNKSPASNGYVVTDKNVNNYVMIREQPIQTVRGIATNAKNDLNNETYDNDDTITHY